MSSTRGKIIAGLATLLATTTLGTISSQAQELPTGIAISRFEAPEPGDPFMAVPSPSIGGHLVPRLTATVDVAYLPFEAEDRMGELVPVILGMQMAHIHGSFALLDRLMVGVGLPIVIDQGPGFEQVTVDGRRFQSPNGPEVGDLRASLRLRLYGEYEDPFQLSIGSYVYFPTGPASSFVSENSFYGHPHLLVGGRARPFIWSVYAGSMLRGSSNPHTITFGAAAGLILFDDVLQIGPEATGQVAFDSWEIYSTYGTSPQSRDRVNAEILGSATANVFNLFTAGVAAGGGLTNAPGTPDGRVLIRIGYAPQPDPKEIDTDNDRIPDYIDGCPETYGVASSTDRKAHGCPAPTDRDEDGILDEDDACPDDAGEPDDNPVIHGCPKTKNEHSCVYEGTRCPRD